MDKCLREYYPEQRVINDGKRETEHIDWKRLDQRGTEPENENCWIRGEAEPENENCWIRGEPGNENCWIRGEAEPENENCWIRGKQSQRKRTAGLEGNRAREWELMDYRETEPENENFLLYFYMKIADSLFNEKWSYASKLSITQNLYDSRMFSSLFSFFALRVITDDYMCDVTLTSIPHCLQEVSYRASESYYLNATFERMCKDFDKLCDEENREVTK